MKTRLFNLAVCPLLLFGGTQAVQAQQFTRAPLPTKAEMSWPPPGTQTQQTKQAVQAVASRPRNGCTNSSGHLRVNGQTHCIRQLTQAEMEGNRRAAVNNKAAANKRQMESNKIISQDLLDQMGRDLDTIGDNIMKPGGRERYRKALELYTDAAARHRLTYGR